MSVKDSTYDMPMKAIVANMTHKHTWLPSDEGWDSIPNDLMQFLNDLGCKGLKLHRNRSGQQVVHYRVPWAPSSFRDIEDPSRYIVLDSLESLYSMPREDLPRIASLTDTIDGKEILAARILELGL